MNGRRRFAYLFGSLLLCLLALPGCSPLGTGLVVGDSMVEQTVQLGFASDPGVPFHGYPGAAPCDYGYSSAMWAQWNTNPHPRTVVLAWSGNNLTSCMKVNGANAVGDDLVTLYRTELIREVAWYKAHGTHVVLESPPCADPVNTYAVGVAQRLQDMEYQLAYPSTPATFMRWSTRAKDAICPGHVFHSELRAADHNHLSIAGAKAYANALMADTTW